MNRKKLNNILKQHFPNYNFRFIFSITYTINSFFPSKDTIPTLLKSIIIYQYNCPTCMCRYIGETTRNLTYRITEHKGISARTCYRISNPPPSSIRTHVEQHKHDPISTDDFKNLKPAIFPSDSRILESLFIKHLNPSLNQQNTSYPLYIA